MKYSLLSTNSSIMASAIIIIIVGGKSREKQRPPEAGAQHVGEVRGAEGAEAEAKWTRDPLLQITEDLVTGPRSQPSPTRHCTSLSIPGPISRNSDLTLHLHPSLPTSIPMSTGLANSRLSF